MYDLMMTEQLPEPIDEYDQQDSPLPGSLLFIFSLFVLIKCLVPASKGRYIPFLFGSYIWWAEILFIGLTLIIVCYHLFSVFPRISKDTGRKVLTPILLLGFFQLVSISWNGQTIQYKAYSFIQTFMMCAVVFAAVMLVSGLSFENRIKVTSRLTLVLTFVLIVYSGLSFLFPSLRPSTEFVDRTEYALGFIRVFGPLAPASTLSFALLPALSYSMSMFLIQGKSKFLWGTLTLIIFVGILATGSRAAVLGLMVFVFVYILVHKISAFKIIVPIAVLFGVIIAIMGIPERFRTLEDRSRLETYKTALRSFASSPQAVIVGVGHGHLYSLLHDNTLRSLHHMDRWYLQTKDSPYGFTLRNSHSSFLQPLAENGLIGFSLFIIIEIFLLWRLFAWRYSRMPDIRIRQGRVALVGCVAGFVLMSLDVYILSSSWLSFIWLIYAICAAETIGEVCQQAETENYYEDYGSVPGG